MSTAPQFSVITAVLDRAELLEHCLHSVACQRGATFEHIVIDGGSTDGSVALLQQWGDRLAFWSSEPDLGIGDAMNKGLRHARGEWLLFLHADDQLLSNGVLGEVARALSSTSARIVGFPIRFGSADALKLVEPRGASFGMRFKTGFLHQGTFIQRSVFAEVGPYDAKYRIAMDYDFFFRAWRRGVPMATFRNPVPTWMRDTGISSRRDWPSLAQRFDEEFAVHAAQAHSIRERALYAAYRAMYLPYRRIRSGVDGILGR